MDTKTALEQCKWANHCSGKRITILGAGIAGLIAAYELERLGHQVNIMEGSPRIGGRIWTHRFGSGTGAAYGELGAMRIPDEHKHVLHYIHAMGLSDKLHKFTTVFEEHNALMNVQGKVFRLQDAPRVIQQRYGGIFLDTRYSEQTRLFAAWLKTIVDTIAPGNLRETLENDLKSHLMDELEKLNLKQFFSDEHKTIDFHAFIQTHSRFRALCSPAINMFLSDILIETSHALWQLEGGMDQLIHCLAAAVKGPIRCNQEVTALHVQDNGVEVSWLENGQQQTHLYDYVLCTIPFSILRKIKLSRFDPEKLDIIHNTVYCPATKVLFHCAQPFWEKQGIRGGASFSDEGIRQTYYPSVKNSSVQRNTLLASYTIGDDAVYLDRLFEPDRMVYVKNALSKLHPEIMTPGMLLGTANISWGNYKWSAGGCTIHWNDDKSDVYNRSIKAARPQNTLFFAGEHCSNFPAWIQGSIESALNAVHSIVAHKFPELTTSHSFGPLRNTNATAQSSKNCQQAVAAVSAKT